MGCQVQGPTPSRDPGKAILLHLSFPFCKLGLGDDSGFSSALVSWGWGRDRLELGEGWAESAGSPFLPHYPLCSVPQH